MEKAKKLEWKGQKANRITMTKDYKQCFAEFEMYGIKSDSSNYITKYIGDKIAKPPCLGKNGFDCHYCCFKIHHKFTTMTQAEKQKENSKIYKCEKKYCLF
jgi:hypothetical protein